MLEYIKGYNNEASPAHCVIEANGLGYFINISLFTYEQLQNQKEVQLYIHENIREDAHLLFGFYTKDERSIFRHLISVNGIGANTARMMLSSLSPSEIQAAISGGDLTTLKGIKGIGAKTAQRVIVDLADKISKVDTKGGTQVNASNPNKEEALAALVMLGFTRGSSLKALDKILADDNSCSIEDLIKRALKML